VDHRTPPGRYRGRRRAPTPPRSRYAAVVTTAVVGAGVVALGSSQALPDLKGQTALGAFDATKVSAASQVDLAGHTREAAGRASRSDARGTTIEVGQQPAQDLWQLPVRGNYTISSVFGPRWGVLHPGTDLAVPEGTPVYAANAGTVILCRWNAGYGNNVMIQHDDGVVSVYGHGSKLLCHEGQQVHAGDLIMLSGNTGFSTGPHLHFELRRGSKAFDAVPFMREHGVDLPTHVEVVTGGVLPAD
jgi:murein DD-endopeptidase MepM/ murein hydrolase activator NlpD